MFLTLAIAAVEQDMKDKSVKMTGKFVFLSGHLPEPVRSQTHLKELTDMLEDDSLREALLESLRLDSSCPDIMKAKVHVALWDMFLFHLCA